MKTVFLDRDGVINTRPVRGEYVLEPEQFRMLPGVPEGIKKLNDHGFQVIVITNQSCVGRGLLSYDTLKDIHDLMIEQASSSGGEIQDVIFCPHHPDDGCRCRKPEPGMLLKAFEKHDLVPEECIMVGDNETDAEAGRRAGCQALMVKPDDNLLNTVEIILAQFGG